jgi:hypothetical protein
LLAAGRLTIDVGSAAISPEIFLGAIGRPLSRIAAGGDVESEHAWVSPQSVNKTETATVFEKNRFVAMPLLEMMTDLD